MKSEEDVKNTIISNFLRPPVETTPIAPLASNYTPKAATSTFKQTIQQARDILTRGYLMMLGTSPEQVEQNRASGNAMQNFIPAVAGVVPFRQPINLPSTAIRSIETIIPDLNNALKSADYLGFDTVNEARSAIRNHPDWIERWDVPSGSPLHQLGEEYRKSVINRMNLEKLGLAEKKYTPTDILGSFK